MRDVRLNQNVALALACKTGGLLAIVYNAVSVGVNPPLAVMETKQRMARGHRFVRKREVRQRISTEDDLRL